MGVYRKKPIEIEAVKLGASEPGTPMAFDQTPNWLIDAFADGRLARRSGDSVNGGDWDFVEVDTTEGKMLAGPDWWIIKGVEGELYPCSPSVFRATYDKVSEGESNGRS